MINHNQASILKHEEVAEVLKTDLSSGLTSFEARERLKKFGPNRIDDQETKAVSELVRRGILDYLSQFADPLIQLLLICFIINLALEEYKNAITVIVAVVTICTIAYVQEYRAVRSLKKLGKHVINECKVIREGQTTKVQSDELVPGDIVCLDEGQKVPADVRLFKVQSLTIDESNLTGERESQPKIEEPTIEVFSSTLKGHTWFNRDKNLIFRDLALLGTQVETGQSKGIVISTGKTTRYGQVFSMLEGNRRPRSPLQVRIHHLSFHLAITAMILIAIACLIGIIQKRPPMDVASYAISLAVVAIPEGLPIVVVVIKALAVLRLSRSKTIIKSTSSMETLGCVQVICISDLSDATIKDTIIKLRNELKLDVKIFTGDSKAAAISAGQEIGLIAEGIEPDKCQLVMSGEEIEKLIEAEVDEITLARELLTPIIYYRVDSSQKANIIGEFQELGRIVATIGDSVNDVVTLKRADLSIAMGSGADVCKEVADIIIAEDNISAIVPAMLEGRGIYHRIQSFLSYQVFLSLAMIIVTMIAFAAKFDPPFTVFQLVLINLLTDGPPAVFCTELLPCSIVNFFGRVAPFRMI